MMLAIESCHKLGFLHRDIKPDVGIRSPSTGAVDICLSVYLLNTFISEIAHGPLSNCCNFPNPRTSCLIQRAISSSATSALRKPFIFRILSLRLTPCVFASTDLHWAHDTSCELRLLCGRHVPEQGQTVSSQITNSSASTSCTRTASTSKTATE